MGRRPKKPTLKELQKAVRTSVQRWNHVHTHGAGDPFNTDGINLYLIRNHIAFKRGALRLRCKEEGIKDCPKESRVPLPTDINFNYCAPKSKSGPCVERRMRRMRQKDRKRRRATKGR